MVDKKLIKEELDIKSMIYTIRGKQVIMDSDVAKLYHYETRKLNQAVKRNSERFPERFCFQITEKEFKCLRSQNVTLNENLGRGQHRKYLPYVFTEYGITMLAGILKSEIAIKVSINIIDAFIEMRKFLLSNGQVFERLTNIENKQLEYDKKFIEQDNKINEVFNYLEVEDNIKERIFFEGQIYDAYSLIVDIIKKASKSIIIIDNYIDESILKMLSKKKKDVKVILITSNKAKINNLDIEKFNKEYPKLEIRKSTKYHDRFIIIDKERLYHLGASIKDLGNKCFGINKIEEKEILEKIISSI
ncbi:MAG: ORF6N domain-containing protein [Ruminococcus sp.]|nr:ORF6N domain-containing protein [Ruminococcus sp.]